MIGIRKMGIETECGQGLCEIVQVTLGGAENGIGLKIEQTRFQDRSTLLRCFLTLDRSFSIEYRDSAYALSARTLSK